MLKNLKKISIIKDKEPGSSIVNSDLYYDRIKKINANGEIILPIGHYSLISMEDRISNNTPLISIYGLGSCVALILFDKYNKICAMSHILLPQSNGRKKIKYPHKFADLSVKKLVEELINQGAKKERIQAIMVGGSKIFDLDNNIMGENNIESTKQELRNLNIEITKENVGGSQGRIIKFDSNNLAISVKKSGEDDFQEL